MNTQQQIAIYQQENGDIQIEVYLEQDTVWLNQAQMVELFGREQSVISRHIRNAMVEQAVTAKSNRQKMHNANRAHAMRQHLDKVMNTQHPIVLFMQRFA